MFDNTVYRTISPASENTDLLSLLPFKKMNRGSDVIKQCVSIFTQWALMTKLNIIIHQAYFQCSDTPSHHITYTSKIVLACSKMVSMFGKPITTTCIRPACDVCQSWQTKHAWHHHVWSINKPEPLRKVKINQTLNQTAPQTTCDINNAILHITPGMVKAVVQDIHHT